MADGRLVILPGQPLFVVVTVEKLVQKADNPWGPGQPSGDSRLTDPPMVLEIRVENKSMACRMYILDMC
jgi:hypothetical protein